jgi:hypothetical protein
VVYFQQGIVGWLMERYPERFGIQVAPRATEETSHAVPVRLAPHSEGAE